LEFFKKELKFLGYIVTPEGLRTDPKKIEAIQKFPLPYDEKTIRQFLGMTGYYRKFIKNYAKISRPISQAIKTKQYKDPTVKQAFEQLIELMSNAPILNYPDWNEQFILTTDASNKAIGAVLSQKDNSGTEHPASQARHTCSRSMLKNKDILY
ncbi:ribonuclease H family protein, partial [Klebsiella pneumoniae]|uniref:ribonuclease H family protein n=1 Tax=Klebsiella pneumoniae TaxID=573 RepID=UPI0040555901